MSRQFYLGGKSLKLYNCTTSEDKEKVLNFEQFNLDPRLLKGVKYAGYETATPIQEAAIPAALRGRDIIGTAQTGTGKTAAFVLPILQRLLDGPRGMPRALIVTPTRELAEQINQVVHALSDWDKAPQRNHLWGRHSEPSDQSIERRRGNPDRLSWPPAGPHATTSCKNGPHRSAGAR